MFLEILSAEEKIFSGEVESVILPGSSGQFQILNNHAPIISSLKNIYYSLLLSKVREPIIIAAKSTKFNMKVLYITILSHI